MVTARVVLLVMAAACGSARDGREGHATAPPSEPATPTTPDPPAPSMEHATPPDDPPVDEPPAAADATGPTARPFDRVPVTLDEAAAWPARTARRAGPVDDETWVERGTTRGPFGPDAGWRSCFRRGPGRTPWCRDFPAGVSARHFVGDGDGTRYVDIGDERRLEHSDHGLSRLVRTRDQVTVGIEAIVHAPSRVVLELPFEVQWQVTEQPFDDRALLLARARGRRAELLRLDLSARSLERVGAVDCDAYALVEVLRDGSRGVVSCAPVRGHPDAPAPDGFFPRWSLVVDAAQRVTWRVPGVVESILEDGRVVVTRRRRYEWPQIVPRLDDAHRSGASVWSSP